MRNELKQFSYSTTERGMQIEITFCARTYKDACTILGISYYTAKQYCHCYSPKDIECIKNPLLRYARFNSGELFYGKPEWIGKLLKYTDLCSFINEYRKVYKTYSDTMKNFTL
jgi:hypothetical protein